MMEHGGVMDGSAVKVLIKTSRREVNGMEPRGNVLCALPFQ